ncbi:amino acid adenylation [Basidiobolus meristosporus CBS 931.73]|uniref:Amino acid adenylation n=1 Tax=Basidiobolus meristosporus CBS 931.73 TaxID=1314790 RepID=A0A1Y1YA82_9FUNG|nr:amino acid adenylation [Basidiobolus meristosporus CBS 931.73]|eukprot:ORX94939.1 amino acid adenylation [Basidiobolus meristosporus CBS 931.73]
MAQSIPQICHPLSAAQTEIWVAQQLNPESAVYNIAQFIEIPGTIDAVLFEEALRQVLMEAEAMRLQFIEDEAGVRQFVGPLNWSLPLIDTSADPNPQAAAEAWMRADCQRPLNLRQGHKFRYALLKVDTCRYIWYQCVHHILIDGYSGALIAQRAAQVYSALVSHTTTECLMRPFAHLLQSDTNYRASAQFTEDQEYWLSHCKDWPEAVTLSGKTALALHQPIRQTTVFSSQLVPTYASDPRHFTYVVIAAIATYLHRWTGAQEVSLGFPAKARFGEDRRIPGMAANVLPIRVIIQPDTTFSQLADQVAYEIRGGLRHQRYRCEELKREPRFGRSQPLFGPTINFMPFDYNLAFGQYLSTNHNLLNGPIDDLAISVYTGSNDSPLRIDFDANPILYTSADLMAHQRRILDLLDILVSNPSQPVASMNIISACEKRQLMDWNDTAMPYPEHLCIHQLFEEQVARAPDATALVYADQVLSYAALNARANCLAHQLIELGVRPDQRVAICVERSPALIVGLLAILKAGGAYVPLDPTYPTERLMHILTDAAPSILLADECGRNALGESALSFLTVLDPNTPSGLVTSNPCINGLTSHHLVYVIYTSGSTGTPKGVMIEHHGLSSLCTWHNSTFDVHIGSKTTLNAGVAFDASAWEIWPTLISGATLVIPDPSIAHNIPALLKWWSDQNCDVSFLVTPLAVMALWENQTPTSLRFLLTGGDRLPRLPESLTSGLAIVNNYGPTETTIVATSGIVKLDGGPSHIGRPIANTRIYLLDINGHPVPLGAMGEIHIGGVGVARGYLNRPELTAERFLPDPFSRAEGARMYKTGDMARYLPDGNLEFVGRNDFQVKIRGYRIEVTEIEAHLVEHPMVKEAVVLALGEESNKRLVAYVVADPVEHLANSLRSYLAPRLPDYMLPAAFVRLDTFPLSFNGKLDRRALPAPGTEAFVHQAYEAPRGEVEIILATIWAELLGLERVSRHDNFFELGGHSLLAVQMVERLCRHGLTASIRVLFESPTLSTLAQSLDQFREIAIPPNLISVNTTTLTPDLLPLINLTQADIDQILSEVPGGVSNIQDIYSLSPLQDGILFHHLLTTVGDPYLLVAQMAFESSTVLDRYLDAAQQVVNRHDILRTAFIWENLSTPAQVVLRHAPISITELSLNPKNGPIIKQLTDRFNPSQHRINLSQAPLLRLMIAQDTDDRWIAICLMHHLIGDHSTLDVMHSEIQAFIEGRGDTLPAPQPFRNLVAQTRMDTNQESHKQFFTDMLADIDEPTLPFGLAEVHRDGANITNSQCILPQDLNDRLRTQARRLGVSLAGLCHLAWARVLACTSGQQQVVFGTVLIGRTQAGEGVGRAMGLFINTLPLCVDLDSCNVVDSVRQTHTRLATLLQHEHASLALAQRCSGVSAETPLFSALLNYRHSTMQSNQNLVSSGFEFSISQERTSYPFTMNVEDFGSALGLTAQIVEPFDSVRVCNYMQQTLHNLVEALEKDPHMPIRKLGILPSDEQELLLHAWNATSAPYSDYLCIHQLFEEQVARAPDATALVYADQVLSYAALNARANCLAHQLIELGVRPDQRVAICVERSPALIVGLLAILKAGGAYVPLDPTYPTERLMHILTDAAPSILLADECGRNALGESALSFLTVLDPNTPSGLVTSNPCINGLTSHHLAYVIYTSGSTGIPKGVMVEHSGVVNLIQDQIACTALRPSSRFLHFTTFSFDVSVSEIFTALGCGASLHLPSDTVRRNRYELWNFMEANAITHAVFPPALLQNGNDLPLLSNPLTLVLIGEAPKAALLESMLQQGIVINAYGPTETSVWSTIWRCTNEVSNGMVSIGRPIANTRIYLLDATGHPVPLGAMGELYIGGAGVARGYLNRPELTAERFLSDPFSGTEGARMYRTGDMARYLPDGRLEFVGRNDFQVKIRGYRIELDEIEAHLVEHPMVKEAVVLALGEESNKRLVAYVVADPVEHLANSLRSYLAPRLPDYMLPAAFVRLDALPLSPNGKLDRRALPVPGTEAFAHQTYEAPRGEAETALAEIWTELLGLERISRHDNFFELGGHSILAVRMISRIRTKLGVEIALRVLFESPSIEKLANQLHTEGTCQSGSFDVLLPIQLKGSLPPLYCIHPVVGLSWSYIGLSKHLSPEQPIYGLQARGLDGEAPLAETIEAMALDYLNQIRSVQPKGPYHLLGWSFGGSVAHSIATLLQQQNETVALLALMDSSLTYSHLDNQWDMDQVNTYIKLPHYSVDDTKDQSDFLWTKVRHIVENNCNIAKAYTPLVYYGNVLFFSATIPEDESCPLITPDMVKPYILGAIETYRIPCKHSDMDKPVPIGAIGRILARSLEQLSPPESLRARL